MSDSSLENTESDEVYDEFIGQFTSNHDFLCTNNQISELTRREGNAQISM